MIRPFLRLALRGQVLALCLVSAAGASDTDGETRVGDPPEAEAANERSGGPIDEPPAAEGASDQVASRETETADEATARTPWRFSATSLSSLLYNGDNRDTRVGEIETQVNDEWGLAKSSMNASASHGGFNANLRLDGAWFYTRPNATQIGIDAVELRRQADVPLAPDDPTFFRQKVFQAGQELSNRTIDWIYPAKYGASYRTRDLKLIVGDFYAQLGRGLVLSVRKADAIASDTTIRGARFDADSDFGDVRLSTVLLAGTGNPLRLDEASGRYLGVHESALEGAQVLTEAGMPRAIDTDFAPQTGDCRTTATCSYAPDDLYGAQVSVAAEGVKLSSQASLLARHTILTEDIVRSARETVTASQTLELPGVVDWGSFYLEGAGQYRNYDTESLSGYALYTSLGFDVDRWVLTFEGKHYRAFYPLRAGISVNRAREFSPIQYSTPPTTEPVWSTNQFENFNSCVSGGRLRSDVHLSSHASVYGWVGRWTSWAESTANETCEVEEELANHVWDLASGMELSGPERRSHSQLSVGVRDDRAATPVLTAAGRTNVFYREAYTRYDALFHLSGPFSLQLQGWHRYRHQTAGGPDDPWYEGQALTALEIAELGNVAFGVEYDTTPRTPDAYFNGQLTYRIDSGTNLTLFVGQRRGAQRCVAGVCRVFPPFEGARLDLTVRL